MRSVAIIVFALVFPPSHAAGQDYYPTKVGSKFTYTNWEGESFVTVVMDVKEKDGEKLITMGSITHGKQVPHERVTVSKNGIAQLGCYPVICRFDDRGPKLIMVPPEPRWDPFETPRVLLDLSKKPGESWEDKSAGHLTFTAGKPEKVKVPAGEFQTLPVDVTATFPDGTKLQAKYWYAVDVGAVKWTCGKDRDIVLTSIAHAEK